jgi:RNA polymerase sigma-70 factor (ECF subfamily)
LFIHFYKPITRFAFAIVKSKEEAEELYTDVMMKIWDLGPDLKGIADLKSYLLTIIKNAALNYIAKYHKLQTTDLLVSDKEGEVLDPEQLCMFNELKEVIEHAVQTLPPKCRMVYQLIRENRYSYKEAAEILEISVNTAERHMTIALQRISLVVTAYHQSGSR